MIRAERAQLARSKTEVHLRKSFRPVFVLPPKPGWRLLIEGFMLLILGSVAVAGFAIMIFAIMGF